MRAFTVLSTLCHAIFPRTEKDLTETDLGLEIKSEIEAEIDESWQYKTNAELRHLCNEQLKTICKSYGRLFSNKNKEKFNKMVLQGPLVSLSHSITEAEEILKYSFLQPLPQEDRSSLKLGSLNEEQVHSVLHSIVEKLGWELVDVYQCGLLPSKMKEYLATSLDGWIVM